MNLHNNKFYLSCFKNSWTYVTGAILLSLLQIINFAVTGEPLKITAALTYWGVWILEFLGVNASSWQFLGSQSAQSTLQSGFLKDPVSIRNLGIIIGALLASLMASQFKLRKIKSFKHILAAIFGGLFMGYGAKIALGCNIGALFGGIASLSLSGWVFALFLFLGAMIGSNLLVRYLM